MQKQKNIQNKVETQGFASLNWIGDINITNVETQDIASFMFKDVNDFQSEMKFGGMHKG
jgi:hypothetical protein